MPTVEPVIAMGVIEAALGLVTRPFLGYSRWALGDPVKRQAALLGEIIRRNRSTLFGKKHDFASIRTVHDYQTRCAVHGYDYFKGYVDAIIRGEGQVLSKDRLVAFAHTTGTTGTPKLVPVTAHTVKTYNLALLRVTGHYIAEDPSQNASVVRGTWLYIPAPALLRYAAGVPVGYITGLLNEPSFGQRWRYLLKSRYYIPAYLKISPSSHEPDTLSCQCAGRNISMVVGTTPVAVNVVEHVTRSLGGSNAGELFPGLKFGIFSGVSPRYYASRIRRLFGWEFTYREVYAASESMLGAQLDQRPGLTLLHDDVFFEFIPVKNASERLLIHEVKKGEEYRIAITLHNGLYAYEIGDILKVVSADPLLFEVAYRKNIIDIGGEKLTPHQVMAAIESANNKCRAQVVDFCVVGTYHPRARYVVIVEFNRNRIPGSLKEYLREFDRVLSKLNDVYDISRSRRVIVEPELWAVKPDTFHDFETKNVVKSIHVGQFKTTRLTNDPAFMAAFEGSTTGRVQLDPGDPGG